MVCGVATAQSPAVSMLQTVQGAFGKDVLVSNDGDLQIICHRTDTYPNVYEFTISKPLMSLSSPNTLICDFDYFAGGDYSILDMQIFDGFCYFCGSSQITPPTTPYITNPIQHEGFIGRFAIADVLDGGNCVVYLARMEKTDTVSRLTVFSDSPQQCNVFILAIGSAVSEFDGYYHTYLIELQHFFNSSTLSWEWHYDQLKLDYDPPREILTDVIVTNNFIEVVSKRYLLEGSPFDTECKYRHHQAKRDGFYKQYVAPPSNEIAYEYSTCPMGGHPVESEKLLMSHLFDDYFYLSYGAYFGSGTGSGAVVSLMNTASQMVENGSFLADVDCHVRGVACMPQNSMDAVLSQSTSYPKGVVRFHPWGGSIFNSQFHSAYHSLQSIDSYHTGHVTLGGFNTSDNSIYRFIQNGNYTTDLNPVSCFSDEDDFYAEFELLQPTPIECTWKRTFKKDDPWIGTYFNTTVREFTTNCIKEQQ